MRLRQVAQLEPDGRRYNNDEIAARLVYVGVVDPQRLDLIKEDMARRVLVAGALFGVGEKNGAGTDHVRHRGGRTKTARRIGDQARIEDLIEESLTSRPFWELLIGEIEL